MKDILTFRVYYKDTDAGGVVYYANYLGWFEAGRTEYLRALGISIPELKAKQGLEVVIKDINCEYLKAARLDDEIMVETQIAEAGPVRMVFDQKILRKSDNELLTRATVTAFTIDLKSFKPAKLPEALRKKLSGT